MRKWIAVLGLLSFASLFVACGSGVEGDLDLSQDELQKKAESMSKAELEQALEDLKALGEEWGKDAQAMGEDMSPEDMAEIGERMGKLMTVSMVYGMELQKRK